MTADTRPSLHTLTCADLEISIATESGALVQVRYGDWSALDRPEVAESFRLLVPLTGRRANWVRGSQQERPEVVVSDNSITCQWHGVRDEHGTSHAIDVRTVITVESDRIVFAAEIDNHSDAPVENVYYPDLGDVAAPADTGVLRTFGFAYATSRESQLRPRFQNFPGYFGVERPTYTDTHGQASPEMPWILLHDDHRGLYLGLDEPEPTPVAWFAELTPGYRDWLGDNVPPTETIGGHPVAVHVAAVHLPYVEAGQSRRLTPIAMAGFTGDWHAGADRYLARRSTWGKPQAPGPDWVREPHSWLQYQLNSPEGERRTTFAELPTIAAECAAAGINTIQLVGWNEGGQDQNNPCHDADEALGGRDGLVRAIEECHRLGVRIVLFTKFTWADRATEWFRDELINYSVRDPYGDYYLHGGYKYQTVTQLLDINTKRLVPMCFGSEEYLRICEQEFDKVVGYGADGMLYDESQHHGPAVFCFDDKHGHAVPYPIYSGDLGLIERLRRRPGVGADFLIAGEAPYDWEYEQYDLGYHRSANANHKPVSRYLRPDSHLMTAITGFDDRNMINQCLLYRYLMSYEPYNFKGRPSDYPDTIAYGKLAAALRQELREWLWDATFTDDVHVSVTDSAGSPHRPVAGFRHADGRLAAVIVNYADDPVRVAVELDGTPADDHRFRLVDDPTWRPVDSSLQLPARSAAVVLPADAV